MKKILYTMTVRLIYQILFAAIILASIFYSLALALSPLPPEQPYGIFSKNGKYLFVMLPDDHLSSGEFRFLSRGLYTADGTKLLWEFNKYIYERYFWAVSSNGNHLVHFDNFYGRIKDNALSFYSNGELIKSYSVADLVEYTEPMTINEYREYHWCKYAGFDDEQSSFTIHTVDGLKYVFDITTGNIKTKNYGKNFPIYWYFKKTYYFNIALLSSFGFMLSFLLTIPKVIICLIPFLLYFIVIYSPMEATLFVIALVSGFLISKLNIGKKIKEQIYRKCKISILILFVLCFGVTVYRTVPSSLPLILGEAGATANISNEVKDAVFLKNWQVVRAKKSEIKADRHPFDNSLMCKIPAGLFIMGSDKYLAEKPMQKVSLDTYYIDKYLVTNEMFAKFVTETKYKTDAENEGFGYVRIGRRWKKVDGASWKKPDGLITIDGKENHPVSQVSHNDSLAYCKWAQKDLPTEAQWEKAARGPVGNEYPWGNSAPKDDVANFDNIFGTTTSVTKYPIGQSIYGVQDMAGNVYQWCKDWYGTGERAAKNPTGPKEGKERVIKGGSFIEGMESLRSANRDRYEPNFSSFLIGFRCACKKIDGVEENKK